MGNTSSIFYPDNGNRRRRAEQLSDDCRYAQSEYDIAKANIAKALGPYIEKVDKVLLAFGCANIDELDKLVLQNATGVSLEHWNNVRNNYDKSLEVDQVIMAAEGIVAVVGFIVSAVGAFVGGIGFFVGLGITADIMLLLGAIGAIYDIINGAIQRSKLRDAINSLVPARLKAKYVQMQMDQLQKSLPTIQTLYQMFEDMGYDKDKIVQKFKDRNFLDSLKSKTSKITYSSIGETLTDMDGARGSWTNEDPDWKPIAIYLDSQHNGSVVMGSLTVNFAAGIQVSETTRAGPPFVTFTTAEKAADTPYDSELYVQFSQDVDTTETLSQSFHIVLKGFEGDHHARVRLHTEDTQEALVADINAKRINLVPIAGETSTDWIFSFVNPEDAAAFVTHNKYFDLSRRPTSAAIYVQVADMYLTQQGVLTLDKDQPSAKLMASYA